MAAPPCMADDGNAAVFVGTFLGDGTAVALCDECLVSWSAALLNAMTGVDPSPFLAAISEDEATAPGAVVEDVHFEPESEVNGDGPPPTKPKSGRTRRESSDPPTATEDPDASATVAGDSTASGE